MKEKNIKHRHMLPASCLVGNKNRTCKDSFSESIHIKGKFSKNTID